MLKKAYDAFIGSPTTAALEEGRGADWRAAKENVEAKEAAPKSTSSSNIERLNISLDSAARSAERHNAGLVSAEADVLAAQIAYEAVLAEQGASRQQHETYIMALEARVVEKQREHAKAQLRLIEELIERNALERTKMSDVMSALRVIIDAPSAFDDAPVPTVRLEQ